MLQWSYPEWSRIASYGARLELRSDPDPQMDYFNDYVLILEQLATLPSAFVFDPNDPLGKGA